MRKFDIIWEIDWPACNSLEAVESLTDTKGLVKQEALNSAILTVKRHVGDDDTYSIRLQFSETASTPLMAVTKMAAALFRLNNFTEETEFYVKDSSQSLYNAVSITPN